ncbi:MFS transporter [Streptococcus sp. S784/96/1]|uniref:MFS transporter n=1 Tax=Streptococcus sp. S784/96/1 TaxID=2653499 RepID=UPI001EE4802F|nr:glycoside-pentoside-hexuronide (GPH):cation symporter [Streptococcus sp. S784/96/1]
MAKAMTSAPTTGATPKEKTKLSLGTFYSLGEVGSQLSWYMINTYLMIFYTDVVGISAGAISMIMLIARVWDAINDPMMGVIADKTQTRWGKLRPYLFFAPPFLAVFNILTFTVFPVTGMLKVLLCLVCYIGAGMAYTAICITYGGLVNLIARDSQVRMNYATFRNIGGSVVSIALSAFAMPMILFFSQDKVANAQGYFWTAVVCSAIMLPAFFLCALKCKETVVIPRLETNEKKSTVKSLLTLMKNKMLMITISNVFLGAIAIMGRMGMLAYYIIYVVGSYELIGPVFTTMTVMQLVGSFSLPWGTKTFGKRGYLTILSLIQIATFVGMFFFGATGKLALFGISIISGFTNAGGGISTGMLSDCIEYGDWKYGIREVGLTYSFLSFAVKMATAVTGTVTVLLLSAVGYVPNAAQTASATLGINVIVNLLPAACVVLSLIPMIFYKLDKKAMDQITSELDARAEA